MWKRPARRTRPPLLQAVEAEIRSMCHADQLERLSLSPHLLRDIGADCGCGGEARHRWPA